MSVYITGTHKQLVRFCQEAGLRQPNEKHPLVQNLRNIAAGNVSLQYVFETHFDDYEAPALKRSEKVDHEMVTIYRQLLVKCQC